MSLPQVWHIYLARSLLSKHLKKILDSVFCLRSLKLLKFVEITKRTKSNSIPKSASWRNKDDEQTNCKYGLVCRR